MSGSSLCVGARSAYLLPTRDYSKVLVLCQSEMIVVNIQLRQTPVIEYRINVSCVHILLYPYLQPTSALFSQVENHVTSPSYLWCLDDAAAAEVVISQYGYRELENYVAVTQNLLLMNEVQVRNISIRDWRTRLPVGN